MIPVLVLGILAAAVEGTGLMAAGEYIERNYVQKDMSKKIAAEDKRIQADEMGKGFQKGGVIKPGDYNYGYALTALAHHVANLDHVSEADRNTLRLLYGRYAAEHPSKEAEGFNSILESVAKDDLDFEAIRQAYLSKISNEDLVRMDNAVRRVIAADDEVTAEEQAFLHEKWEPYLQSRKNA